MKNRDENLMPPGGHRIMVILIVCILLSAPAYPASFRVHAEESDFHTAPNGLDYRYMWYFEADYGSYSWNQEVFSNVEVVAYTDNSYSADGGVWYRFCAASGPTYPNTNGAVFNHFMSVLSNGTVRQDEYKNNVLEVRQEAVVRWGGNFPFKVFDSLKSVLSYFDNGDLSGWMNKPPVDLEADGVLDEDMPIPHVTLHQHGGLDLEDSKDTANKFCHFIDNAVDGWNIEVKGKYLSADDIELYREDFIWKTRVHSYVSGGLSTWISYDDSFPSSRHFEFSGIENAEQSRLSLLDQYPISERNIYGGGNSVGAFFTGRESFRQQLQSAALSAKPYTVPEFYVRFWYEDDSGIHYSRWDHFYESFNTAFNDNDEAKQSDRGLSTDEIDAIEQGGSSHTDPDLVPYAPGSGSSVSMDKALSSFSDVLVSLSSTSTGIVGMFTAVFGFLPWWANAVLGAAVVLVVVLRFLGR